MRPQYTLLVCMLLNAPGAPLVRPQSLAELAKKEAERRQKMDQQGVQARTIQPGNPSELAPGGAMVTSSPARSGAVRLKAQSASSDRKPSLEKFRSTLQKLDGDIRRTEERLASTRRRLEAEADKPVRLGRSSNRAGLTPSRLLLQNQIQDLEIRIRRLRDERARAYDQGRKAGFLPGELDGRYITP